MVRLRCMRSISFIRPNITKLSGNAPNRGPSRHIPSFWFKRSFFHFGGSFRSFHFFASFSHMSWKFRFNLFSRASHHRIHIYIASHYSILTLAEDNRKIGGRRSWHTQTPLSNATWIRLLSLLEFLLVLDLLSIWCQTHTIYARTSLVFHSQSANTQAQNHSVCRQR